MAEISGDVDGPDPLLEVARVALALGASRVELWAGARPWVSVRFPRFDVKAVHRLFRHLGAVDVAVAHDPEFLSNSTGWVTGDSDTRIKVTVTHVPGPSPAAAAHAADAMTGRA